MGKFMPINTKAKPSTCTRCKQPIWDITIDGVRTKLDTSPLPLADELQARLNKQRTFQLHQDRPTFTASLRHQHNIPATKPDTIVIAQHQCQGDTMIATGHPDYWPKSKPTQNQEALF